MSVPPNFDNWENEHLSSLSSSGDFVGYLNEITYQISSIYQNQKLSEPFQDYTEKFLSSTIPRAVKKIIRFQNLTSGKKLLCAKDFCRKLVQLVKLALKDNIESLYEPLTMLLDTNYTFYTKTVNNNSNKTFFAEIFDEYFHSDEAGMLPEILRKSPNLLNIKQFKFVLQIYKNISKDKYLNRKYVPLFVTSIRDKYVSYLSAIENLHQVDTRALRDSIEYFIDLTVILGTNESTLNTFAKLFEFFLKCLKYDMLEKQAIGARSLSYFCTTNGYASEFFTKTQMEVVIHNILHVLFDLRVNIITLSLEFLKLTLHSNLIISEQIILLYNLAINSEESEQIPLFSFIADSITSFHGEDKNNLLNFFYSLPDSPETYKIYRKLIEKLWNSELDRALNFITKIMRQTENDSNAREAIINIYQQTAIPPSAKSDLVNIILSKFKEQKSCSFAESVLISMVKSQSSTLKSFFNGSWVNNLIGLISKENRGYIFRVISLLVKKNAIILEGEDFQKFITFGQDDILWEFYKNLAKNTKIDSGDDFIAAAVPQAVEFMETSQITPSFIRFLKAMIKFVNQIKKSYSRLNDGNCQYIDIVFKALLASKDDESACIAEKFLIKIVSNAPFLYDYILTWASGSINDDLESFRCMHFLIQYITKSEITIDPEDFNKPRQRYPNNYLLLKCYHDDSFLFDIHIDPDASLSTLLKRIRTHINSSKVKSLKYPSSINNKQTLASLGFKNEDKFDISKNEKPLENMPPPPLSLRLSDSNIIFKLLSIADKSTISQVVNAAEQLLNLLPGLYLYSPVSEYDIYQYINIFEEKHNPNFIYQKYYLQTLLYSCQNNSSLYYSFIEKGGINILFKLSKDCSDPFIFEALDFFYEDQAIQPELSYLIIFMIDSITKNKGTIYLFRLLSKCYTSFPRLVYGDLYDNIELLNESLEIISPDLWEESINFLGNFDNDFIFSLCKNKLEKGQKNLPFFIKIAACAYEKQYFSNNSAFLEHLFDMLNWPDIEPAFADLASIICSHIEQCPNKEWIMNKYESNVNSLALTTDNDRMQTSLFQIIQIISSNKTDQEVMTKINEADAVDRWGYKPEMFAKNHPYCGLRNLGSTCFFNSIIQILFHLFPVQLLMATYDFPTSSEFIPLKQLFLQMRYSERKYCDTESFIKQWHGWFGSIIDTHEQQDAVEFFDIFLDQLPSEISQIFKGKLINTYKRANGEFFNSEYEPFTTIGVNIKNTSKLETSLANLLKEEELTTCDNKTDQKITIKKSVRISNPPPVLAIHMKRFEYDLKTNERVKINDNFEFPNELDISTLLSSYESMNNSNEESSKLEKLNYSLYGIIVHSGIAIGGHYLSYIKIKNKWWMFNDIEVESVTNDEMKSVAFGSTMSSAYVLFYVDKTKFFDFKNYHVGFDSDFDYKNDVDIESIKYDNKLFKQTQAIFSKPTINFIMSRSDVFLNLSYLIRILCHTHYKEEVNQFTTQLIQKINEQKMQNQCYDYLLKNVDHVYNIFMNCSEESITLAFAKVISFCSNHRISICKPLLEKLKGNVYSYRQVPRILDLVYQLIHSFPRAAIENELDIDYIEIIEIAYKEPRLQIISQLNFTSLFKALQLLKKHGANIDKEQVTKYSKLIKKSNFHIMAYSKMLKLF